MPYLVCGIRSPGHGKETVGRVCARWNVGRDQDRPFVVDIGAGLCVLSNNLPGLAPIIRQRELAGSTTMARGFQTRWWRKLCVIFDSESPEADGDDLAGSEGRHWSLLVTAAGEGLAFIADPGMDGVAGIAGPGTSLARGIRNCHVG